MQSVKLGLRAMKKIWGPSVSINYVARVLTAPLRRSPPAHLLHFPCPFPMPSPTSPTSILTRLCGIVKTLSPMGPISSFYYGILWLSSPRHHHTPQSKNKEPVLLIIVLSLLSLWRCRLAGHVTYCNSIVPLSIPVDPESLG
jgi:hypothetical protein